MTQSDPKSEIKPTMDHLSDPYVLQLIEALARRDDEIEHQHEIIDRVALIRLDLEVENRRLRAALEEIKAKAAEELEPEYEFIASEALNETA